MLRVAAIDCGTNSIRLLIADVPDPDRGRDHHGELSHEPLRELVRQMRIVRLGQGVDRTGRLAADALERTRLALAEYSDQIAQYRVDRVRMVATSATRDAANSDEFTAMVRSTMRVAPEVVSGLEEARLSFSGAIRGLPAAAEQPYLVVDIGGGSTEFVVGGSSVAQAMSVDVGCVRMTERHFHDDPPTPEQISSARGDVRAGVEKALAHVAGREAKTVVGLAGSVTTVAALALNLERYQPERVHHASIRFDDVCRVSDMLLTMTSRQRLELAVMHPGRADVIGAGALIVRIVMEQVGARELVASEHDILDGIAWSMA